MMNNELNGLIKESPKILSTIYEDLAQPSVRKVGEALGTVFEFSTAMLLPIKLLNAKFKLNFEQRLNSYKKKLEAIDDDKICEVNPQLGTPLLEKLSYTTNDEIANLFVNLLAKASSYDTVNLAHPSFIQIIERLSVDEARIIQHLYGKEIIPYVSFRVHYKSNGFIDALTNATSIPHEIELLFPQNASMYIDNLVSVGILNTSHGLYKMNDSLYAPLFEKYGFEDAKANWLQSDNVETVHRIKGYYQVTNFGKAFIEACTR